MLASFNGNPYTRTVSGNSSTNVSNETDIIIIIIYNQLSFLVRHVPKHNVLIIGGDTYAHINKDGNNKFCLRDLLNRNEIYQADFSLENRLSCLNTKFQKRKGKQWIWTYSQNIRVQLDYTSIDRTLIDNVWKCEAHSSIEGVFYDHRIVSAKIPLSQHRNKKQTIT